MFVSRTGMVHLSARAHTDAFRPSIRPFLKMASFPSTGGAWTGGITLAIGVIPDAAYFLSGLTVMSRN